MKRRILDVTLMVLSAISFGLSLYSEPRELAYGLLTLAYALFILAVIRIVARAARAERVIQEPDRP